MLRYGICLCAIIALRLAPNEVRFHKIIVHFTFFVYYRSKNWINNSQHGQVSFFLQTLYRVSTRMLVASSRKRPWQHASRILNVDYFLNCESMSSMHAITSDLAIWTPSSTRVYIPSIMKEELSQLTHMHNNRCAFSNPRSN